MALFIYQLYIIIRGVNKIKNYYKSSILNGKIIIITVSILFISPVITDAVYSIESTTVANKKIVARLSREIEIPAGSDYSIEFFPEKFALNGEEITPYSSGLSENVSNAIAKSPRWIQRDLTRQFQYLSGPEKYAEIIIEADKRYTDEIAFSIACSPMDNVPQVEVIKDNVFHLYEIDEKIRYADIIDYEKESERYYSTIGYNIIYGFVKC